MWALAGAVVILMSITNATSVAAASTWKVEKLPGVYQFTEGPVWTPWGTLLFSDTPDDKIWEIGKRDQGLPLSLRQPQRKYVRSPGPADYVRARQQKSDPHGERRHGKGPRGVVRGQATEQPERHSREVRRDHLLHRPVLRSRRCPSGIAVQGSLSHQAGRQAGTARQRLRHAQRPVLLDR